MNTTQPNAPGVWRKCSSCKATIGFSTKHYVCSVSTCNGLRTGYVFCSVPCFERHLPGARHRDAAAVEATSPSVAASSAPTATTSGATSGAGDSNTQRTPTRMMASTPGSASKSASLQPNTAPKEVLVIASRLKDYINARSEFSTSASVMDVLSDHLRILCERAIDNARADGRKTVMDRDFEFLKKS